MKKKEKYILGVSVFLIVFIFVGCSQTNNTEIGEPQNKEMSDNMEEISLGVSEEENKGLTETVINTSYVPVEYRENALIVQKSKDMKLYGLLDNKGNVVLEPKYDSLDFTLMNGKNYIKAKLVDSMGVLNLDGTECVKMGLYTQIASAGDIGWLAEQNDKQYLLNEGGEIVKELKEKYICCTGNHYLLACHSEREGDVKITYMLDGSGGRSHEMPQDASLFKGDIYDLNENLLISAESQNILLWNWLIDEDKFGVIIQKGEEDGRLKLIDASGKIIKELADNPNTSVIGVVEEEQKIILRSWGDNIFEYDLDSGTTTASEFNGTTEWDSRIIMKKAGDFYQCYKDGKEIFDDRFADYSFDDGVLWLENTDSQWGVVDYDGNMVIPFGERGNRDSYTEILDSEGMFGFYTENMGNYEFHNYVVAKGKISG